MGNLLIVNMPTNRVRIVFGPSPRQKSICLKRMNFCLTVIGLHVCYNQEILVSIAAGHRQICVIYKRLFIFAFGGGGGSGAI